MINLYYKYELLIVSLTSIIAVFLTIYFYIEYKRQTNRVYFLYYTSGFLLNSIAGFIFLIRDIRMLTYNNLIYYYKVPLVIGMAGFIIITIGAYKERSSKNS